MNALSQSSKDAIETARRFLASYDVQTAAHVLRDLPEIKERGLTDLAWAMTKDAYISKNDVLYLIEKLEAA